MRRIVRNEMDNGLEMELEISHDMGNEMDIGGFMSMNTMNPKLGDDNPCPRIIC